MKKSFDLLTPKQRQAAIKRVIDYFATERDEKIGVVAAEGVLDMFLDEIGKELFNSGVKEAKKLFKTRLEDMGIEMDLLLKEK